MKNTNTLNEGILFLKKEMLFHYEYPLISKFKIVIFLRATLSEMS